MPVVCILNLRCFSTCPRKKGKERGGVRLFEGRRLFEILAERRGAHLRIYGIYLDHVRTGIKVICLVIES